MAIGKVSEEIIEDFIVILDIEGINSFQIRRISDIFADFGG